MCLDVRARLRESPDPYLTELPPPGLVAPSLGGAASRDSRPILPRPSRFLVVGGCPFSDAGFVLETIVCLPNIDCFLVVI